MADKKLIVKRIKEAYQLRTNVEVARFLGVSAQVLSNWQNRNTVNYDTIIPRCPDINLNWLIRGEGDVFIEGGSGKGNPACDMASEENAAFDGKKTKKRVSKAKSVKKPAAAKPKAKKR